VLIAERLPAYARALIAARDRGRHPEFVSVLVSRDWSARERLPAPVLCVDPRWRSVNWTCCVALAVNVHGDADWEVLAAVAADIADFSGPVTVLGHDVSDLAFAARRVAGDPPRFAWPPWWSAEREHSYQQRRGRWWTAYAGGAHVRAA